MTSSIFVGTKRAQNYFDCKPGEENSEALLIASKPLALNSNHTNEQIPFKQKCLTYTHQYDREQIFDAEKWSFRHKVKMRAAGKRSAIEHLDFALFLKINLRLFFNIFEG